MRTITRGRSALFVGDNPTSRQMTNALGEAVFDWVPSCPKESMSVRLAEDAPWREAIDREPPQSPDGVRKKEVVPLPRSLSNKRVAVSGQLSGPTADVSGLLIQFLSDQGDDDDDWDAFQARCDASGRFKAQVLPGNRYKVFVEDRDLVTNLWDGVIADSPSGTIRTPELTVKKGVPVQVRVTKGRDQKPMQNVYVLFEESRNRKLGPGFWGKTDERGRFVASVAAGPLKVRVSDGDWNQEKTVQIVEDHAATIHLHRQHAEQQQIVGTLVLPPGVRTDQRNTTVTIAGMDGESEDTATVKPDADGRFSAGITAGRVSILATSSNEDFFGCAIADVRAGVIEIPMYPAIRYEGSVVQSDGEPVARVRVAMTARLVDRGREYPRGTPEFEKQYVELFRDRTVITNAEGHFVIPRTPQRMELSISLTKPGESNSVFVGYRFIEPGQPRPPETIRLGLSKPKPLELEMADTLGNCRLAEIHALIIITGSGDSAASFARAHLFPEANDDETNEGNDDVYSYLTLYLSGPQAAKLPDRRAFFATRNWPFPESKFLFLAAVTGDGKELGRLSVNASDGQAAAKEVAAFVKRYRAPQCDAKAGFEAALAEAKRSNRRVWVRVGQTRCEPCFSFSRWLDSQRDLLEKDYVLFKFDDALDLNGKALSAALKFDGHGVPCHAILDSDGTELINSVGPLGNLGDVSGSFEGAQHLRKMLMATVRKLSEADIESLIRSLPKD